MNRAKSSAEQKQEQDIKVSSNVITHHKPTRPKQNKC